MPELPEVHTTATMLNKLIKGLVIKDVWTNYDSAYHKGKDNIKDTKFFQEFKKRLLGGKITQSHRRGKNVLIDVGNSETIIIHMKMTGHLLYGLYSYNKNKNVWHGQKPEALKDPFNQWVRFVITFTNGKHLALSDMRKFAKVTVVKTETAHESTHLKDTGPEPLEKLFTLSAFKVRLMTKPNGKIKQVLMNPETLAGIGNIYSDEILFDSNVHPLSIIGNIPEKVFKKMFSSMKTILCKGIDFGGDSMSDYRNPMGERGAFQHHHQAYRRTGEKCPRRNCGGTIHRLSIGGRNAHFCNKHQKNYS